MERELFLNGKDAWVEYGIDMLFGAYAALICPAAAKEYVTNEARTDHGKEYAEGMRFDERSIALPLGIRAKDRDEFYTRFTKFVKEVCAAGDIAISTGYDENIYYCKYKSVTALTEYNGRKGTFVLNLIEANPMNR